MGSRKHASSSSRVKSERTGGSALSRSYSAYYSLIATAFIFTAGVWAFFDFVFQSVVGGLNDFGQLDREVVPVDPAALGIRAVAVGCLVGFVVAMLCRPRRIQIRSVENARADAGYGADWRTVFGLDNGIFPDQSNTEEVVECPPSSPLL